MAQDLAERGVAVRHLDPVEAQGTIELEVALLDALQQEDRGKRSRRVTNQVGRVRRRTDPRRDVLKAITLLPQHHAVAHERGRHSGNAGLLAQRLQVRIENGNDAERREEGLLAGGAGAPEQDDERGKAEQLAHVSGSA